MKKTIAMFFIFGILICCLSVYAESIDFSTYTDDEIIKLFTLINEEMLNRKMIKTANIPGGSYTVGIDIPAGRYSVKVANENSILGPTITIYHDVSKQSRALKQYVNNPEDSFVVDLSDGMVFQVDRSVIITTFTGILFE